MDHAAKIAGIAAAVAGLFGTVLLYVGSYSLIPPIGMVTGGPGLEKQRKAANKRLLRLQRLGLGFLSLSFLLGGVAAALS